MPGPPMIRSSVVRGWLGPCVDGGTYAPIELKAVDRLGLRLGPLDDFG